MRKRKPKTASGRRAGCRAFAGFVVGASQIAWLSHPWHLEASGRSLEDVEVLAIPSQSTLRPGLRGDRSSVCRRSTYAMIPQESDREDVWSMGGGAREPRPRGAAVRAGPVALGFRARDERRRAAAPASATVRPGIGLPRAPPRPRGRGDWAPGRRRGTGERWRAPSRRMPCARAAPPLSGKSEDTMENPSDDLSTTQRPHLLIPFYWALGLQHLNFDGTQTFSPKQQILIARNVCVKLCLKNSLGGGGTALLRSGPQGKVLGQMVLDFQIKGVPDFKSLADG
ncbi:uncharacterized protein [Muntiacus reevesi]|uniref:uncharacterized protein n=1 Tax=Muntiacus reevesi TaxID=9886 RepID=UPI0033075A58